MQLQKPIILLTITIIKNTKNNNKQNTNTNINNNNNTTKNTINKRIRLIKESETLKQIVL